MKNRWPIALLAGGLSVFGMVWIAQSGPPDHNIGRSIFNGIIEQIVVFLAGGTALIGLIWLIFELITKRDGAD